MNALSGVGRQDSKVDYEPPKEEKLIEPLPNELFAYTLSFLNDREHLHCALVSRRWNKATIDVAKSQINHFIQFLVANLNKETGKSQIESLKGLQVGLDGILEKMNLFQIKDSICKPRENILNIIKILEEKDINSLEERSKDVKIPVLFADVFSLSRIYKKIDEAKAIPATLLREYALQNISEALTQSGHIAKAIEVANLIPSEWAREW